MFDILNTIVPEDGLSTAMDCKYDVIGITDVDEVEETKDENIVDGSPFVPKIM